MSKSPLDRRFDGRPANLGGCVRRFLLSTVGALVVVVSMAGAACSAEQVAEEPNPLLAFSPPAVNAALPADAGTWSAGVRDSDCTGVQIDGIDELEDELAKRPDGTTFCLAPGMYRVSSPLAPDDGHRLVGGLGVVLSGAKPISSWSRAGSVWTAPTGGVKATKTDWSETLLNPQSPYQEDLFLSGVARLKKVGVQDRGVVHGEPASTVGAREYFVDYDNDRLILGSDPTGRRAELSVTPAGIDSAADGVTIESLRVEKFAGPGIDSVGGEGWRILTNEFRQNHTRALKVYGQARVIGNYIHHNGQYGVAGTGDGNVFSGNEIAFNNTARFARSTTSFWDAGGTKFVRNTNLILRNNYVHDNFGDGLWLDIDNAGVTVAGNRVERNHRMGINYEISFKGLIKNNEISGNGDAGIWINSSRSVSVTRNLVKNNDAGIIVVDQDRSGYEVRGVTVDGNRMVASGITGTDDTKAVTFSANSYTVRSLAAELWMWDDVKMDAAAWKELGHDAAGEFKAL